MRRNLSPNLTRAVCKLMLQKSDSCFGSLIESILMSVVKSLVRRNSPISQLRSTPSPKLRRQVVRLLTPKCRKRLRCSPLGDTRKVSKLHSHVRRTIWNHEISNTRCLGRCDDHTLSLLIGSQNHICLKTKRTFCQSCEDNCCSCLLHQVEIGPRITKLGRGSFGVVVTGKLKRDIVALKICKKPKDPNIGEINALNLRHPHLVRILAIEDRTNIRLIVMDIGGERSLQEILDSSERFLTNRRMRFCRQICSAISYCHSNDVVHSDLKPSNILVSRFDHCKLADFGCSIRKGTSLQFCILGTPKYCAPEVLRGSTPTPKSDVYSFGILMWQLYTREIPYPDTELHTLIYSVVACQVRPEFGCLVKFHDHSYAACAKKCWNSEPQKRPTSKELVSILKNISSFSVL
ncbi:serine/threonine-protein kinase mos-like [Centruroides sculpturatus]|uniref:serine/threonine-protein kinase mos-like n=1 Tax=Centruroides sculpturatus TaxID=218467 RepID=UPI000C6DFB55|nr:serine/threonine-protein kinase mos-like [Centruroides sculpturatus]